MSKSQGSPTCVWVTSPAGQFPATYCGCPSTYTIERDDDGERYRQYSSFCFDHAKKTGEAIGSTPDESEDL